MVDIKKKLKIIGYAFVTFFILSIVLEFLLFRNIGYTELFRLFILALLCVIIILSFKKEK